MSSLGYHITWEFLRYEIIQFLFPLQPVIYRCIVFWMWHFGRFRYPQHDLKKLHKSVSAGSKSIWSFLRRAASASSTTLYIPSHLCKLNAARHQFCMFYFANYAMPRMDQDFPYVISLVITESVFPAGSVKTRLRWTKLLVCNRLYHDLISIWTVCIVIRANFSCESMHSWIKCGLDFPIWNCW